MPSIFLWGWDSDNEVWLPVLVNSDGKLIIDPSEIFENPPTDGEEGKAPSSNWAYDHWKDPNAHHNRQHALDSGSDHTGTITDAQHGVRTLANAHAHSALSGIGADDHHDRQHALSSGSDHTGEITDAQHGERTKADAHAHSHLSGIGTSDHHIKYTDAEAIAAAKTDATLLNYTEGARVYHDADQTIPTATHTALAFNSERYDTDTIHDTSTNNSRLTCKTAGKYLIVGNVGWEANAAGTRILQIQYGGGAIIAISRHGLDTNNTVIHIIATIFDMAVNDYVELTAYQDTGGNLSVLSTSYYTPRFMMQRIG